MLPRHFTDLLSVKYSYKVTFLMHYIQEFYFSALGNEERMSIIYLPGCI